MHRSRGRGGGQARPLRPRTVRGHEEEVPAGGRVEVAAGGGGVRADWWPGVVVAADPERSARAWSVAAGGGRGDLRRGVLAARRRGRPGGHDGDCLRARRGGLRRGAPAGHVGDRGGAGCGRGGARRPGRVRAAPRERGRAGGRVGRDVLGCGFRGDRAARRGRGGGAAASGVAPGRGGGGAASVADRRRSPWHGVAVAGVRRRADPRGAGCRAGGARRRAAPAGSSPRRVVRAGRLGAGHLAGRAGRRAGRGARRHRGSLGGWHGACAGATAAVLLAAWTPAQTWLGARWQPPTLAGLGLAGLLVAGGLGRRWRPGPAAVSAVAVLLAAVPGLEATAVAVAGPVGWLVRPWTSSGSGTARGLLGAGLRWTAGMELSVLLALLAGAALVAGWVAGRTSHCRWAGEAGAVAMLAAALATAPYVAGLSYWAAVGCDLAVAAVGLAAGLVARSARWVQVRWTATASGAVLAASTLAWSLATPVVTAAAYGAALLGLLVVLIFGARLRHPGATMLAVVLAGVETAAVARSAGAGAGLGGLAVGCLGAAVVAGAAGRLRDGHGMATGWRPRRPARWRTWSGRRSPPPARRGCRWSRWLRARWPPAQPGGGPARRCGPPGRRQPPRCAACWPSPSAGGPRSDRRAARSPLP